MQASHRELPERPPPASADAIADLAQHLRLLLEREGLTPRQFAAAPDVPYSSAMLYRFLTGESLPPRDSRLGEGEHV
jgi:hypothetical protein